MKVVYDFERTDELAVAPLAARRALEVAKLRLTPQGWRSLPVPQRMAVAAAGALEAVDVDQVRVVLAAAQPPPAAVEAPAEPDAERIPEPVKAALGTRPAEGVWTSLRALDRWVLARLVDAGRPDAALRAFDEMTRPARGAPPPRAAGESRMVDVSEKPVTHRRAVATAKIRLDSATVERIVNGDVPKGDVLGVARVAAIVAAKRTPDFVPLCHVVALTRVEAELTPDIVAGVVSVRVVAEGQDRTGVEMEAMTGAAAAALCIYDMTKSLARWSAISEVRLEEKSGGRSGTLARPPEGGSAPEEPKGP